MQLTNINDKRYSIGVVKPPKLGEDGKPHPVDHVLELCEVQAQNQIGHTQSSHMFRAVFSKSDIFMSLIWCVCLHDKDIQGFLLLCEFITKTNGKCSMPCHCFQKVTFS